ncbi:MAG TPA: Maf family nucleotide pyrophosphatase [Cyclobacteriaceae bacterium]|nr:Maf family nucleotide pyrophosphatase [Cyclobacteriaceae bacterium]
MNTLKQPLILASTSPRRQFLMKEAGFEFRVEKPDADESFPDYMPVEMVPRFLAEKKAEAFKSRLKDEIVMTADTVVIINGKILNKPADTTEAINMLTALSGKTHKVITAVCLLSQEKQDLFHDTTKVTFKNLTSDEIEFYIDTCKPFDKAGSYGAQDWLGMVGIEKINGSYFNVMGLPMHKVYRHLMEF